MKKIKEVTDYINSAPAEQQDILNSLRTLITETVPNATENWKWSRPVYANGANFCYLQSNKKYVTLGFTKFEKIIDELQLLEGTGKSMRHIKIKSKDDFRRDIFKVMIGQAAQ